MHVLCAAHAAADSERHEAALRSAAHHIEDGAALLVARGDVEEAKLVGASFVVSGSCLDRIARISQVDEVDAFDDAAFFHIKAGDDANLQHGTKAIQDVLRRRRSASQPKNTIVAATVQSTKSTRPAGSDK